tara:strand:+ start:634 stop:1374 length:741 start_codon:yes stop_codon:yes gene_type:complete
MAKTIKIIVPSTGRPCDVLTNIHNQILCIPESEKKEYKKHNECEIITHKDNIIGLGNKRQWIYEKFGDVFMLDDDIVSVERKYRNINQLIDDKLSYKIIQENYNLVKNMKDVFLFGFSDMPSTVFYKSHAPFHSNSIIKCCAFGILKHPKLYFTNKMTGAHSYWITLLNKYYNRKHLIDERYHFRQKRKSTYKEKGGQAKHRTLESEKRDSLFLRMMFGESVVLKKQSKKSTTMTHKYQRSIKCKI